MILLVLWVDIYYYPRLSSEKYAVYKQNRYFSEAEMKGGIWPPFMGFESLASGIKKNL